MIGVTRLYAQAFDRGERAAFEDRLAGILRARPARLRSMVEQGFWDGYTPSDPAWWRECQPVNREALPAVPLAPTPLISPRAQAAAPARPTFNREAFEAATLHVVKARDLRTRPFSRLEAA